MNKMKLLTATALTAALALPATVAGAADFSPTISFELSDTKIGANPELNMTVEQEEGEEELARVELKLPKGFKLPKDALIPNGTRLGTANIVIDAGPRCNGQAGSAPATLSDRPILEQDRTDAQADSGVVAVWVVDIRPVTSIPLEITGGRRKGWTLAGDIPPNQFTCPPFTFNATINQTAGDVPIVKNPNVAGAKVFSATFTSLDSPTSVTIQQSITITP